MQKHTLGLVAFVVAWAAAGLSQAAPILQVDVEHRSTTDLAPGFERITLNDGGYHLSPDPIYTWAISNEWSARGAERLRELAAKFEAGKRPPLKGGYPLRSDILDVWRREAAQDI